MSVNAVLTVVAFGAAVVIVGFLFVIRVVRRRVADAGEDDAPVARPGSRRQ